MNQNYHGLFTQDINRILGHYISIFLMPNGQNHWALVT
jgi:hypothetical protein